MLTALYIGAVVALIAGAVNIWQLRCEGFGCIGVGVAWLAWVGAFAIVLGLGLFARHVAVPGTLHARATRAAWWLQLLIGALALTIWLYARVAAA